MAIEAASTPAAPVSLGEYESVDWRALPTLEARSHAYVPEQVAETLRREIAAGRIPPGTKLPEVLLATTLGVSRHTLRAGLHLLEEDGIAERVPNRGVFVLSPSRNDLVEIYGVRRIVEPGILRTVTFGAEALSELERLARGSGLQRITELAEANQAFHRLIVSAAASDMLDRMMARVFARMQLAFSGYDHSAYLSFRERHITIVEHLRRGEPALAAAELERYLDDSERIALTGYAAKLDE